MRIEDDIERLERQKNNTRFADLARVCQDHFGRERMKGSHHIWKTPWKGDPRINLQEVKGRAKPYQVEQVIDALQKKLDIERQEKEQTAKGDTHYATDQNK